MTTTMRQQHTLATCAIDVVVLQSYHIMRGYQGSHQRPANVGQTIESWFGHIGKTPCSGKCPSNPIHQHDHNHGADRAEDDFNGAEKSPRVGTWPTALITTIVDLTIPGNCQSSLPPASIDDETGTHGHDNVRASGQKQSYIKIYKSETWNDIREPLFLSGRSTKVFAVGGSWAR